MRLILILLSFCVWVSCENKPKLSDQTITVERNLIIKFNPKFAFYPNDSGTFIESKDGKEYFYFCNQTTERELKIFSASGDFVSTVSLKNLMRTIIEPFTISVVSEDTIIFNTFYTNEIVAINKQDDVWFYVKIDELLPDSLSNKYEFWSNAHKWGMKSNLFVLKSWPTYNLIDDKNLDYAERTLMYYKCLYNSPHFLIITDLFSANAKLRMGVDDLYTDICNEDCLFDEIPCYRLFNGILIFFSEYSDNLFIIDIDKMIIDKNIQIKSNYTKVGNDAIKIDKNNLKLQMDYQNDERIKKGRISNLFFDVKANKYLVLVTHTKYNADFLKHSYIPKYFSIIVLDRNFNQLGEILFDSNKYNPISAIMTDSGIAFEEINQNNNEKYEKTYVSFKID
ncbi:MAG: hypothetical protein PHH30_07670 [Bacteroidales bacterium]|nr:hypothetical protein [Bacteroidales bacterium]